MVQLMCWNLFTFQRPLDASTEATSVTVTELGCKAKVSGDHHHEMRAKAAPLIFGLLSDQADTDRLFFSPLFSSVR